MEKVHLLGFTEDEMKSFAREMGEAAFRGRQIFRWKISVKDQEESGS